MPYYLYWAHNAEGVEMHFISEKFYDIGTTVFYEDKSVIIDDYAVEYDMSVFE